MIAAEHDRQGAGRQDLAHAEFDVGVALDRVGVDDVGIADVDHADPV